MQTSLYDTKCHLLLWAFQWESCHHFFLSTFSLLCVRQLAQARLSSSTSAPLGAPQLEIRKGTVAIRPITGTQNFGGPSRWDLAIWRIHLPMTFAWNIDSAPARKEIREVVYSWRHSEGCRDSCCTTRKQHRAVTISPLLHLQLMLIQWPKRHYYYCEGTKCVMPRLLLLCTWYLLAVVSNSAVTGSWYTDI